MHSYRFPGETPAYRAARHELLGAERELRRQVERVAAARRKLPMGGKVPEDYVFAEDESRSVKLSELFAPGKDTLVLYGFMYGPEMEQACPMCTCFLDGLNGNAMHIAQRVNLAVAAKSPIARVRAHAKSRGWNNLRMLSWGGSKFGSDYHCEIKGGQNTILHVFSRRPDGVHHFWSSELNMIEDDPGQNGRHIDLMWPLWNVLDTTPEGRGTNWFPSLSY